MSQNYLCRGDECAVKNTCLRYTSRNEGALDTIVGYTEIRKCTNQKKYVQDETKIVKGR